MPNRRAVPQGDRGSAAPSIETYAAFLPAARRRWAATPPVSSRWPWRGHDVHIARAPRPDAPVRLLVVHGVGGHGGALWPLAAPLADRGLDVAAVDLPLYGRTRSPDPGRVRYDDWVALLVDLVEAERDGRPLVLLGASLGGLLAVETAARSTAVDAVVATCLLDPADPRARMRMTRFGALGVLGPAFARLVRGRVAGVMVPVASIAKLSRMSRDPGLSAVCAADPRGGGAGVPLGFLASYLRARHTDPASITTPVTLAHPEHDDWTPMRVSTRVLDRLGGPTERVLLRECGHFPIEEPGLTALDATLDRVAERLRGSAGRSIA